MQKIRKGDEVVLLRGSERGRTGKVLEVRPDEGRVVVEGCNLVTRHRKKSAKRLKTDTGPVPAGIPVAAVALVSKKDGKPVRVHFEVKEVSGKVRKVRVAARTEEQFD